MAIDPAARSPLNCAFPGRFDGTRERAASLQSRYDPPRLRPGGPRIRQERVAPLRRHTTWHHESSASRPRLAIVGAMIAPALAQTRDRHKQRAELPARLVGDPARRRPRSRSTPPAGTGSGATGKAKSGTNMGQSGTTQRRDQLMPSSGTGSGRAWARAPAARPRSPA